MINLLPSSVKSAQRFARINTRLLHYLWLVAIVAITLAVIFGGAIFYLNLSEHQAKQDLSATQASIHEYDSFKLTAKATSDRLTAIKTIQANQTRFSLLLQDIAKVLPQSTSLNGITLTGDAAKPVQISVLANSYDNALAFRNALASSPRIAAVDLISINKDQNGYTTSVIIAFKPGAAK